LEQAISFIRDDELLEVTPQSLRRRKAVLSAQKRHVLRGAMMKKE
jgi:GTP-binding protein